MSPCCDVTTDNYIKLLSVNVRSGANICSMPEGKKSPLSLLVKLPSSLRASFISHDDVSQRVFTCSFYLIELTRARLTLLSKTLDAIHSTKISGLRFANLLGYFPLCQTDRSEISRNTRGKWNDIFRLNRANH